ncbi:MULTISPECIES: hypothetical protein [Hyphomonas]|uniref:hypothetical protein n=1 Tax=Hyphomonas TaxID=85 RepID=UPI003514E0C5
MRNLIFALSAAAVCALVAPTAAGAGDDDLDELVRLPGQTYPGPSKRKAPPNAHAPDRLVSGGGLIVSFDTDLDGEVTQDELAAGISASFAEADTNEDGYLSPLEQLTWAESQPIRDDTLGNPARFDPNLDRQASFEEFKTVLTRFAADFASESGSIDIADLKAPKPERQDKPRFARTETDRPPRN